MELTIKRAYNSENGKWEYEATFCQGLSVHAWGTSPCTALSNLFSPSEWTNAMAAEIFGDTIRQEWKRDMAEQRAMYEEREKRRKKRAKGAK